MLRVIVCLVLAAPLTAWAADSPDQSFFKQAGAGGLAEVDAGTLAQSKGNSQAVKDFGAMMVKDHAAANDKLKSIADSEGVSLPTKPSISQMAAKTKLEVLSGDSFDKAYIKNQVVAHQRTVALFRKEIASGSDPKAKAFAQEALPTIRSHLKKIRQVATDQGVSTK
jgi:putative membrane protein